MKNAALTLLLFLVFLTVQAQKTQRGMVREQNSGKKPVSGAQVVFSEANPKISDNDGLFTLTFDRKKAGEWAFLEDVYKKDYELVNKKEIEQVKLSSDERLGVDVILAPAGKLDAARREYYDISDKALLAGFEREKRAIRDKLQKSQLSQQEYEEKYENLQTQYDQQQQQLDQLADKFARVNFDDVDTLYKAALELFQSGDIEGCKRKLESANLIDRTSRRLKERERIASVKQEIEQQESANEIGLQEDIQAIQLQTQTYLLSFEFEKAEALYDQLLILDSTNLTILREAADFYREQHRYEKAIKWYPKVIFHQDAKNWQAAEGHRFLGEVYQDVGMYELAFESFVDMSRIYDSLFSIKPEKHIKNGLAMAHGKLGEIKVVRGELYSALAHFEKYNQLKKDISNNYPNDVDIKSSWALSYSKLGDTYLSLGNITEAFYLYKQSNQILESILDSIADGSLYQQSLALSYERLGSTYSLLGGLDSAFFFFEKRARLGEVLCEKFPNSVNLKLGLAVSYYKLGTFYLSINQYEKALIYLYDDLRLLKELYINYSSNVNVNIGFAKTYESIAFAYDTLGQLDSALVFYELHNRLTEGLVKSSNQNLIFKAMRAISYSKLSYVNKKSNRFKEAMNYLEKYRCQISNLEESSDLNNTGFVYKEIDIAIGNPGKLISFFGQFQWKTEQHSYTLTNGYADCYFNESYDCIEIIDMLRENHNNASVYINKIVRLIEKIKKSNPDNEYLIQLLSVAYQNISRDLIDSRDLKKALTYSRKHAHLFEEILINAPSNTDCKDCLATSYGNIGLIYAYLGNKKAELAAYQKKLKILHELQEQDSIKREDDIRFTNEKLSDIYASMGEFKKALLHYESAIQHEEQQSIALPENLIFKQNLAASYAQIGFFYKNNKVELNMALSYFKLSQNIWQELADSFPDYTEASWNLSRVSNEIEGIEDTEQLIRWLKKRLDSETDTLSNYQISGLLCEAYRKRMAEAMHNLTPSTTSSAQTDSTASYTLHLNPQMTMIKLPFAEELNHRAWTGILLKRFDQAEADIREGLKIDANNKYLNSNLAPALLFQGKREEAFAEYQKLKDHKFGGQGFDTYRAVFLDDLNTFEKTGIIPSEYKADVELVRSMLNK